MNTDVEVDGVVYEIEQHKEIVFCIGCVAFSNPNGELCNDLYDRSALDCLKDGYITFREKDKISND